MDGIKPNKSKLQRYQEGFNEFSKPLSWEDIKQLAPETQVPTPTTLPPRPQSPEEIEAMNKENALARKKAFEIMDKYGKPPTSQRDPAAELKEDAEYYDALQQFESEPDRKEEARQNFLKIQKAMGKLGK